MQYSYIFAVGLHLAVMPVMAALAAEDYLAPEASSSSQTLRAATSAKHAMAATAHPLATQAAIDMLKSGGNALDAAFAAQLVLNVVEPQSSGIGGGGFLLYYNAAGQSLSAFDGRETAPEGATPTMFLGDGGQPLPFDTALTSGRAVGVPGLLRMMELAHKQYGRASWSALFHDAIRVARDGFPMGKRLHQLLRNTPHVQSSTAAMKPYLDADGQLKGPEEMIRNPDLAATLMEIANRGPKAFYEGSVAEAMVAAVATAPLNGTLSAEDLLAYQAVKRQPVCAPFQQYKVCSMPPPSSGGLTVLQMLNLLSYVGADKMTADSVEAAHAFTEAGRLAFADRNRYIGDPEFTDVPVRGMLDATYLKERAKLFSPRKSLGKASPGTPPSLPTLKPGTPENADVFGPQQPAGNASREGPSTTHLSIVDADGNAVSMTTSIEHGFGTAIAVRGFLLNNQLTDFSFSPTLENGTLDPNRVEPRKRPRSSMSPVMVFDGSGQIRLIVGSPGGARIIPYVAKAMMGVLAWGLDIQQAINLPHYLSLNGPTELEEGTSAAQMTDALKALGHEVVVAPSTSGLHGVEKREGKWLGGADPRREGNASGY